MIIFNEEELVPSVMQQTETDKVHSFVKCSIMIKGETGEESGTVSDYGRPYGEE